MSKHPADNDRPTRCPDCGLPLTTDGVCLWRDAPDHPADYDVGPMDQAHLDLWRGHYRERADRGEPEARTIMALIGALERERRDIPPEEGDS